MININMKKTLLLFLLLTSCTVYTEKQSEVVSQSVYATKDSISDGRIDLASEYINQVTEIIKPPKHPIKIDPVYEDDQTTTVVQKHKPNKTMRFLCESSSRRRVVILPEDLKGDKVISVNSIEYNDLLKNKRIAQQLQQDNQKLLTEKKAVVDEITKQTEMNNKMIKDLNFYQKEVYKLRYQLLLRDIALAVIVLLIGAWIYVKASKPIPFL
jgi:hypothetical protein